MRSTRVNALVGLCLGWLFLIGISSKAQDVTKLIVGRNINMVSGTTLPGGDPYLQRQNEPSAASSTRNPLHLLAGANDYRMVGVALDSGLTGDTWLGLFKSFDGGQTWQSTLPLSRFG